MPFVISNYKANRKANARSEYSYYEYDSNKKLNSRQASLKAEAKS